MNWEVVLITGLVWFAAALAVFIVICLFVGAVVYIRKYFFHIEPRWMFGLFD